ncbi:MAG: hypothetical protein GY816_12075 [Cytophagales bacterium]|nr:hypothetical protein [Cytophagales bacterium]
MMRVKFNGNIPHQRGGNLPAFEGYAYQKGHGLGSLFKGLLRMITPIAKQAGKAVGKQALHAGASIMEDYASGANLKESAEKHVKRGARALAKKAAKKVRMRKDVQGGGGLGRRPGQKGINKGTKQRRRQNRKKPVDIFQHD